MLHLVDPLWWGGPGGLVFFFLFFWDFQDIVRRGRGPLAEVGCRLHETCSSRESGCKPMLADVMNRKGRLAC